MMIIILRQSLIGDDYFHMINVINNDDIDHIDYNDVQWSSHPSAGMVEILSIYSFMASLKISISIGVGELAKLQNLRVYWKIALCLNHLGFYQLLMGDGYMMGMLHQAQRLLWSSRSLWTPPWSYRRWSPSFTPGSAASMPSPTPTLSSSAA